MKKNWIALLVLAAMLCLTAVSAMAAEVSAPTDFTFDPQTGEFSFNATDSAAGYYFVRIYPVVNGAEAKEYVASSKRINGSKTGTLSGKVDVSTIGWGQYDVKLITFAASGTGDTAPSPVILSAYYGVGGTLERPEYMAVVDGNTVEITVDWYTLSDYKDFQLLPTLRFSLYADAECTTLVDATDFDANDLVVDTHPTGAYIWEYSLTSGHMNFVGGGDFGGSTSYCLIPEATLTAPAGTYYVTVQAISGNEEMIASSKVSDVIEVTLTDEAPDFENFEILTSTLWTDTSVMGMPTAASGGAEGRIDCGRDQQTTSLTE